MYALLAAFGKIAPYLTQPLVLVGFVLLLSFGIHRTLLKAGIIPPLTARTGGKVVQLLLRYPSTVAYIAALLIHRHAMLGILDAEGYPVEPMGWSR